MRSVRSLLYVPANRREWVQDAPANDADGHIFDLEDAVPLDDKDHAREVLAEELPALSDGAGVVAVRVNPPDTGLFEADLEAVVRPGLDAVVLPKLPSPEVVSRTDHVLEYLERTRDIDDRVELVLLPETPEAFRRAYDLCTASDRVAALVGATSRGADVQRNLGFTWTREGTEKLHMLSKMIIDGRAAGIDQLLSGPWHDVDDVEGLREEAHRARQLGYTGYQIIHPDHAEPVNEIFLPDEEEVERAREIVTALEEADAADDRGVIRYEGEMVDLAHARQAEDILERARSFDLV